MYYRVIDKVRRITIPEAILRDLCWSNGDKLELIPDQKANILLLRKNTSVCFCCGTDHELKEVRRGLFLCKSCLHELVGLK